MRNHWMTGLCGLAATVACTLTVWGQEGPHALPNNNPEDLAQDINNREQAIARFRAQHPGAEFYESVNRITKVYGSAFGGGASPHEAGEAFRFNHAAMLGVPPQDLIPEAGFEGGKHLQPMMYQNGQPKFTGVNYTQKRDGLPVYRSRLILLTRNETNYPLVLATADVRDLGSFTVDPQALQNLNTRAGVAAARRSMPAGTAFSQATPVIFAGVDDTPYAPVLALNFTGQGGSVANGDYSYREFVADAATGAILYSESLVYDIDITGTVNGMVTDGYVADACANENSQPLPYLRVSLGATNVWANANGAFTMPNAGSTEVTLTAPLIGQYFVVNNQVPPTSSVMLNVTPPGPATILHNAANATELTRAEVNAYRHANIARDLVVASNPAYPTVSTQSNFPINVNLAQDCNAFYSASTINFYDSGGGCNNTSFGTVVHHEYGHNVVAKGGSGQGAYGEGMGDVLGVLVTDGPITGVGFQSCSGGIRTAANSCQYLTSGCSSCGSEVHACGNLISGCVWSLRNNLAGTNPGTYRDILADLAVNSILVHTGSLITPQITIDYLTLDDNDGNINNGTPHYTEIANGFGAHAMPAPPLNFLFFDYPNGKPTYVNPNGTTTMRVNVTAGSQTPAAGTGLLFVDTGSGYVSYPMTVVSPNVYDAVFPAAACGKVAKYYVSAQTTTAQVMRNPANAPTEFYSTVVAAGGGDIPFNDSFQTDLGWTVSNDAALTDGPWERGVPISLGVCNRGNPGTDGDASGSCYVTDNSSANACNSDVDGGTTTLTSPNMDATGGQSMLSYWRWYSNTFGAAPNADTFVVQISSNGGGAWQTLETVGPAGVEASGGWFFRQFSLGQIPGFALTNQFKVRFVASDLGAGSVIEAGIDAVQLQKLQCALVPGDVDGNGTVNVLDLLAVLNAWGPCPSPPTACPADIAPAGPPVGDGQVTVLDLLMVINNWS